MAQDRDAPYGYVVTWSVEDLLEEYVRPARIVRGGREVSVPAFDDLQRVDIPGVGEMEDFFSDGLRTLLETLPGVTTMGERTLRGPGHAAAIQPLVADGRFVGEIRSRCAVQPARDLVVLDVVVSWAGLERRATLIDRFDAASGLTAMARTTALTTAAVARLAATHGIGAPGVTPLERLAHDPAASAFVLGALAEHGIRPTLRESAAA